MRPPGHHAERDQAIGFCLLNNVAIAAEFLIRRRSLRRVAIVDIDVHHGNGTQHIFEDRADVLYVSLHEYSGTLPFPGTGDQSQQGRGVGTGYTVNIPLAAGSENRAYRRVLAERLIPVLRDFSPEFLLVSTGFDAVADDTIANINLEPASFAWITGQLMDVADTCLLRAIGQRPGGRLQCGRPGPMCGGPRDGAVGIGDHHFTATIIRSTLSSRT